MSLRFTIHDPVANTNKVIDEPIGMDKVSLHMKRDETYHGFLDALDDSLGSFQFYGEAYKILRNAHQTAGVDAELLLIIEYQCADTSAYDILYNGRFSFEQYKEVQGASGCYVECAVINGNDLQTFRNRMNQKICLDNASSFEGEYLENYKGLGENIKLNAKMVRFLDYATIDTAGNGSKMYAAAVRNGSGDATTVGGEPNRYSSEYFPTFTDAFNNNVTDSANNEFLIQGGANACITPYTHIRSSEFGEFPGVVGDHNDNTDIDGISELNEIFQYTPDIPYENNNITIDIDISGAIFHCDQRQPDVGIDTLTVWLLKGLTWSDARIHQNDVYRKGMRSCRIDKRFLSVEDASGFTPVGILTLKNHIIEGLGTGGTHPADEWVDHCVFRYVFSGDVEFFPGEKLFLFFQIRKSDDRDVHVAFFSSQYTYRNTFYFDKDPITKVRTPNWLSPHLVETTVQAPKVWYQGNQLAPPPASFIKLTFDSTYKSTTAPVYMVNEALSRSVELMTNDKVRVYSKYFGRSHSDGERSYPYETPVTGPAGLTALSNGLLLRGYSPLQTYYMGVGQFQSRTIDYSLTAFDVTQDYHQGMGSIVFADFPSIGILRIPDDTSAPFPIGAQILIEQVNSGQALILPVIGVTLSAPAGVATRGRGSKLLLTKVGDKSWMITDHAPMFVSFQEMIEALNCIHAVGFGLEQDTVRNDGHYWARVEPICYFYNRSLTLMQCDNVETLERNANAGDAVSILKTGYTKWEAEEANGLDEFLSRREYRTTLHSLRKTLDRECKYIASGYAIEVTRRKYGTSTTDWRYDNDTFILCLAANTDTTEDAPAYMSEAGGVIDSDALHNKPTGMLSPDTVYNYRISPARNALRWLPYIANCYTSATVNPDLVFTSGNGNYIAQGQLVHGGLERVPVNESQALKLSMIDAAISVTDGVATAPIYKNELVKFKYPMTYEQWRHINTGNNKYGKIRYNVNEGVHEEGYIMDLKYDLFGGMAEFTLRPKL